MSAPSTLAEAQIDAQAQARIEAVISEVAQDVAALELKLATLAGYFDRDLAAAIVGAMGLSAGEVREQVPSLRQAVRDLGSDDAGTPNNEVWS